MELIENTKTWLFNLEKKNKMYRTQTVMEDTQGTNMEQYSLPVHYLHLPKPEISSEKL